MDSSFFDLDGPPEEDFTLPEDFHSVQAAMSSPVVVVQTKAEPISIKSEPTIPPPQGRSITPTAPSPPEIKRDPTPVRGPDPRAEIESDIKPDISPTRPSQSATNTKQSKSQSKSRSKSSKSKSSLGIHHQPITTLKPHGLPPVDTTFNEEYVYLYFRFCAERHRMWGLRSQGVPRAKQTKDECMNKTFVGNVFRELDPSGARDRDLAMEGEDTNEEICFRSFLFTGFYFEDTYKGLRDALGSTPSWKTFNLSTYETILGQLISKQKIYYGGFQMVPPKTYFGLDKSIPPYCATLRMIKAMMEMGLPDRLSECRYAVDASELIRTIPSYGGFLSLCLLCFLQDSPKLKFYYRNFATCGPGSRGFLKRIFGSGVINGIAMEQAGLQWLCDNQWKYWARLREDPPHAWELGLRPGMRVLDVENALCWCHRYVNDYQRKGYRSLADLRPPKYDAEAEAEAEAEGEGQGYGPPAWCDEEKNADSASRPVYAGDYEEEAAKLGSFKRGNPDPAGMSGGSGTLGVEGDGDGEDYYEVEKIVCRLRGDTEGKNGIFRVRWKGYPPEDDTWEKEADLSDSKEAVDEWKDWERMARDTIARIRKEDVYSGPKWVGGGGAGAGEKGESQVGAQTHERSKRAREVIVISDDDDDDVVMMAEDADDDEGGNEQGEEPRSITTWANNKRTTRSTAGTKPITKRPRTTRDRSSATTRSRTSRNIDKNTSTTTTTTTNRSRSKSTSTSTSPDDRILAIMKDFIDTIPNPYTLDWTPAQGTFTKEFMPVE